MPNFGGDNCEIEYKPCDTMKCQNGGVCVTGANEIPFCNCPNKQFAGTQCEIDLSPMTNNLASFHARTAALGLDKPVDCDMLGNEASTIHYVFAVLIIFLVLVVIVVAIYVCVQSSISRTKKYMKQVNYENEIVNELNDVSNRFK